MGKYARNFGQELATESPVRHFQKLNHPITGKERDDWWYNHCKEMDIYLQNPTNAAYGTPLVTLDTVKSDGKAIRK